VTAFIRCDGGCGKEWVAPVAIAVTGPAIRVERVNGLSGAGMPDPDRPLHFCEHCGPTVLRKGVPQ
jgi:hypothetical protein